MLLNGYHQMEHSKLCTGKISLTSPVITHFGFPVQRQLAEEWPRKGKTSLSEKDEDKSFSAAGLRG